MKKTVWTFGLISGAILSVMMLLTLPFADRIGVDKLEITGYTTMVIAGLLIYFGIRSYRENFAGGAVSFGRAFAVGSLICLISSACYVATWQVIYYKIAPDFMTKVMNYAVEKARAEGAEAARKKADEMQKMAEYYKNPLVNVAVTFIEPLPVGLVLTLVSAGVLSRKRRETGSVTQSVTSY